MLYLDWLDEYLLNDIYFIIWLDKMKNVIKEVKTTVPYIVTSHGGVFFFLSYKMVRELKVKLIK
jgi:prevent-host-death family protein